MATIRIPEELWRVARAHLLGAAGEHFAFFLARGSYSRGAPIFLVRDVILVADSDIVATPTGAELSTAGILAAINAAATTGDCLVEIHNHGGLAPRFSLTDRQYLPEFVEYALSSLPGRPYGAMVSGDETVYGEYFLPDGVSGIVESVLVVGDQVRQIVSRDDDGATPSTYFDRQLPWFTKAGQQQLGRLSVGVIGCGGVGSQVLQSLVYLGCRAFVLVDDDRAEATNMNRLVTATPADIGVSKVALARRLLKGIAPDAKVIAIESYLRSPCALDTLKGVDFLFGCVDNDGARLVLNELAVTYSIPYIDAAVGIEVASGRVQVAGGRVATILPRGPCLYCMGQIDINEAQYFLSSPSEQEQALAMGYIAGVDVPAPAVGSLNALVAAVAVNEFATVLSGLRSATCLVDYDLLGSGRGVKSQWLSPIVFPTDPTCVQCAQAGMGDAAGVEQRFALTTTSRASTPVHHSATA